MLAEDDAAVALGTAVLAAAAEVALAQAQQPAACKFVWEKNNEAEVKETPTIPFWCLCKQPAYEWDRRGLWSSQQRALVMRCGANADLFPASSAIAAQVRRSGTCFKELGRML